MCDEYDDEQMAVFWRRLEEIERRKQTMPESEETVEPLLRIEPEPSGPAKPRARTLVH